MVILTAGSFVHFLVLIIIDSRICRPVYYASKIIGIIGRVKQKAKCRHNRRKI